MDFVDFSKEMKIHFFLINFFYILYLFGQAIIL